jgi:hypothetical protein
MSSFLFPDVGALPGGERYHPFGCTGSGGNQTCWEDEPVSGVYGFAQLVLLFFVYAFVLYHGSNMISNGSELLLLIPSFEGLVGSVVLPVLGGVPEGALVIFSGMGPDAQNQVSY